MSLLQDAASYEENRWRNRVVSLRSQAARDYLGQLGKIAGLLVLSVLLLDGARRDVLHGVATVVAVTGNATLQTASGKSGPAPSFVGQTYSLGDTLTTDATGIVTLAFPDSTVIRLGPQNSLRQTQSDSFRSSYRRRDFQISSDTIQIYNPNHVQLSLVNLKGSGINLDPGIIGAIDLAGYAVKPSFFGRVEQVVWWPLDFLLGKLGITRRGTLMGTDSQRRDDCRKVCAALQKTLATSTGLPEGPLIPLENLGLPADTLSMGKAAIRGPYISLESRGTDFRARVSVRDSSETVFTITPQSIQEERKK